MKLYYITAFDRYNSSRFLSLSCLDSKNNKFFILLQFGTLLENDTCKKCIGVRFCSQHEIRIISLIVFCSLNLFYQVIKHALLYDKGRLLQFGRYIAYLKNAIILKQF